MTQRKKTVAAYSLHLIEDTRKALIKLYKDSNKPGKAAEWEAKSAVQP
jgi:hypothetical protein